MLATLPRCVFLAFTLFYGFSEASLAQEIPEQRLAIPSGRPTNNLPAVVIIPIRQDSQPFTGGGWILVYRNLERPAQTPSVGHHSQSVYLPGMLAEGLITWEITHTQNEKCSSSTGGPCPDLIYILSVPDGFVAVPESAQVDERDGLRIFVVPIGMS